MLIFAFFSFRTIGIERKFFFFFLDTILLNIKVDFACLNIAASCTRTSTTNRVIFQNKRCYSFEIVTRSSFNVIYFFSILFILMTKYHFLCVRHSDNIIDNDFYVDVNCTIWRMIFWFTLEKKNRIKYRINIVVVSVVSFFFCFWFQCFAIASPSNWQIILFTLTWTCDFYLFLNLSIWMMSSFDGGPTQKTMTLQKFSFFVSRFFSIFFFSVFSLDK